jgi:hypothetical protein
MPDQTEPRPPLLIVPLPVDVGLGAAVLLAARDWWTETRGEPLVMATDPAADVPLREELTPYGRALVLRQPPAADEQTEVDRG